MFSQSRNPFMQLLRTFFSSTKLGNSNSPASHQVVHHLETGSDIALKPHKFDPVKLDTFKPEFKNLQWWTIMRQSNSPLTSLLLVVLKKTLPEWRPCVFNAVRSLFAFQSHLCKISWHPSSERSSSQTRSSKDFSSKTSSWGRGVNIHLRTSTRHSSLSCLKHLCKGKKY